MRKLKTEYDKLFKRLDIVHNKLKKMTKRNQIWTDEWNILWYEKIWLLDRINEMNLQKSEQESK